MDSNGTRLKRRGVLLGSSGTLALGALAGRVAAARRSRTAPALDLQVGGASGTMLGNADLFVTVVNEGSSDASATIVGEIRTEEGGVYTRERTVAVPAGEAVDVELHFAMGLSYVLKPSEFEYEASLA